MEHIQNGRSVWAGVLIGIGGCANLYSPIKLLGAALFSIGLIAVMIENCSLYTGKIGFIRHKSELLILAEMLLGNIIGALLIGQLLSPLLFLKANEIMIQKLSVSWDIWFIKSVMCGILIYLAVDMFNKYKSLLVVILPVFVFVMCGFDHCIANVFYLSVSKIISFKAIGFIITCIIGNTIGSLIATVLQNVIRKDCNKIKNNK